MAISPDARLSFDEVVERVLDADPESSYVQATAFEEATKSLHDARWLPVKQRRSLEDAWPDRLDQRFVQMDGLVRHLGDTIVDSRQRLLDVRHPKATRWRLGSQLSERIARDRSRGHRAGGPGNNGAAGRKHTEGAEPVGQPCRGHTGDHRLGFTGGRKSTEQGEDAR